MLYVYVPCRYMQLLRKKKIQFHNLLAVPPTNIKLYIYAMLRGVRSTTLPRVFCHGESDNHHLQVHHSGTCISVLIRYRSKQHTYLGSYN